MADGGENIPGPDDAHSGGAPLHARPASPQAAAYEDTNPPEAASSRRSWWPFCLIAGLGGCGCILVVALAFGLIGGVSWTLFGDGQAQPPVAPIAPQLAPDIVEPSTGDAPGPDGEAPIDISTPGAAAAMAWANNRRADWQATINDHSEDWTWVRLLMGPPNSEWTTWVDIQWNTPSGRYGLLDEGPIAQGDPAPGDAPDIYQPGEEVAKEAALGYAEQPDWVTRVDKHSDDWRTATVSVGPPASEWVWAMDLRWNDSDLNYDLVETRDVFSGPME